MTASPQDVQALIDAATVELDKTTSGAASLVKKYGTDPSKWPSTSHWYKAMASLAAASAEAGQLVTPSPPPPPPPPTPTGTVDFDGRASKFATLYTSGVGDYGLPNGNFEQIQSLIHTNDGDLWTALAFRPGVIKIEPDPRWGPVYHAYGRTGVVNPWNGSNPDTAAGQTTVRQPCNIGQTRFYSIGVRIDHWNGPIGDLFFCDVASLGYQTSSNDQVSIALGRGSSDSALTWSIAVNGGETGQNGASIQQGNAPGTTNFKDFTNPVVLGLDEEFIYEVKWSSDDQSGYVKVYNRPCPGGVSGSWKQIYEKDKIDTLLWGDVRLGDGTIQHFAQNPDPSATIIDKVGVYFKEYGGEAEDYVYTGLHICDNLDLAKASFPA